MGWSLARLLVRELELGGGGPGGGGAGRDGLGWEGVGAAGGCGRDGGYVGEWWGRGLEILWMVRPVWLSVRRRSLLTSVVFFGDAAIGRLMAALSPGGALVLWCSVFRFSLR